MLSFPDHKGAPGHRSAADLLRAATASGGASTPFSAPDPAVESIPARWQRLYSAGVATKELFNPAYLDAVAFCFAAAILAVEKDTVGLLVIGGGDGHFSRKVLPAVREIVEAHNPTLALRVLETDVSDVIRKAPGESRVVDAHKLHEHFAPATFDIVVGEAMMHQDGPAKLPVLLDEVARVLTPEGIFVHVQDTIPDPRDWVADPDLRELYAREVPLMETGKHGSQAQLLQMAESAHKGLIVRLQQVVEQAKYRLMVIRAEGEAKVDAQSVAWTPTALRPGDNGLSYFLGTFGHGQKPGVPEGTMELHYTGLVSFVRPHRQLASLNAAFDRLLTIDGSSQ